MDVTYRLKPEELTDTFFKIMKETFSGKEVSITVEEIQDETDYLLSNRANREHLLKAADDMKNGRNVHTMDIEEMEAMIS
ncbi:MAG: hypothetical protein LBD31_08820 [Treponema sp.]|jgi:hypothetical protein|nr:hypothetical protein [Treponema sp.]